MEDLRIRMAALEATVKGLEVRTSQTRKEAREQVRMLTEKLEDKENEIQELKDKVSSLLVEAETWKLHKEEVGQEEESPAKEPTKAPTEVYPSPQTDDGKEKTLLIRKGRYWKELIVAEWIEEKIGPCDVTSKGIYDFLASLVFGKKKKRDQLWMGRWVARKKDIYKLDEWLSEEERQEGYHLICRAREYELLYEETGTEINTRVENRKVKLENFWFKWNREEMVLEKLEGEQEED